jgi:hypothetical protein
MREKGMEMHEGNRMGRRKPKRARLVAAATALAGAATYGNRSITITQNTSMIVDVSTLSGTTGATVSWGDVSWSDVL